MLPVLQSHDQTAVADPKTQNGHSPGKPGKVSEFDIGQGKVRETGFPVVCYRSCDSN